MANPRTVLITGANRGIGLSVLRALATASPSDQYILAGRSQKSITEALDSLRKTPELSDTIRATRIEGVVLDVTDDQSINAAVDSVQQRFGTLNVLVNNAGIAIPPPSDGNAGETRKAYNAVLDANVTSVANVTQAFMPLLLASSGSVKPLVVNISSGRASLARQTTGKLPATANVAYSVSKVAVNALTIELARMFPGVVFHCANPGHCATQLNGFRGARDPLEGANVVVELVKKQMDSSANGEVEQGVVGGFWETIGSSKELVSVPW